MRIVHQRCCALDVHKRNITACVLVWDGKQLVEELDAMRLVGLLVSKRKRKVNGYDVLGMKARVRGENA